MLLTVVNYCFKALHLRFLLGVLPTPLQEENVNATRRGSNKNRLFLKVFFIIIFLYQCRGYSLTTPDNNSCFICFKFKTMVSGSFVHSDSNVTPLLICPFDVQSK